MIHRSARYLWLAWGVFAIYFASLRCYAAGELAWNRCIAAVVMSLLLPQIVGATAHQHPARRFCRAMFCLQGLAVLAIPLAWVGKSDLIGIAVLTPVLLTALAGGGTLVMCLFSVHDILFLQDDKPSADHPLE